MISAVSFALVLIVSAAHQATTTATSSVCAAEPHAATTVDGARLVYRDLGPDGAHPVLLIGGTDQQMTQWPKPLIDALTSRGFRPIVYDARDVGCSSHHIESGPVNWGAVFGALASGRTPELAYDLQRLAADAATVLDEVGVERADIIGVSGGATVAGEIAITNPQRVGRLVLLMANSGNPALPMPADPIRIAAVPPPPLIGADAAVVASYRIAAWRALEGGDPLLTRAASAERAEAATARSWDPDGIARFGVALLASGDRRANLMKVRAPTVVIHGESDPLISVAAGREVAEAIPNARFVTIPSMGHTMNSAAIEETLVALTVSDDADE